MEHRYDIRDLGEAHGHAVRYADKHMDLAGYHAARYRAFAAAFGAGGKVDMMEHEVGALEDLAASTAETLDGLRSPFAGFLEAPERIIALYSQFAHTINIGIEQTREALLGLQCGALAALHGIPEGRTIGNDDLLAHGFDPAAPGPKVYDYL